MTGELATGDGVSAGNAGWNDPEKAAAWRELGFQHAPIFAVGANAARRIMPRASRKRGGSLNSACVTKSSTLDAVYTHDASLATDFGMILMNPGKKNRRLKPRCTPNFARRARHSSIRSSR